MSSHIGITSTVPVEIIYAAGLTPVDLNNVFVNSDNPYRLVEEAEAAGFPRNYCAWIKGIYAALKHRPDIDTVIGVMQGDCSNTAALKDILINEGREFIPFAYPSDGDERLLSAELDKLSFRLGAKPERAEGMKDTLDQVRGLAHQIDALTWKDATISGSENHAALVNTSDFKGDPESFSHDLSSLLEKAGGRRPRSDHARLAYLGVPPIATDLYETIESLGASVVYNEVQREFSMPHGAATLLEQYAAYTYPYGARKRIAEIKREIVTRRIIGCLHYVQSFCYHQLDDIVIRDSLNVPVLRLEADKPGPLDSRAKMRLEAFIETLGG